MTLVALIMVLLTAGLYLGIRSWEAVDGKTERVNETRLALEFIRRELMAARAVTYQLPEGEAPVFWGNQQMLEWVAPLPSYVGYGGLSVMRLSAAGEADHRQLVFERWLFHPQILADGSDAAPPWVPLTAVPVTGTQYDPGAYGRHILIEQLQDFQLAYFGTVAREEPQWYGEWAGVPALPRLVMIRLRQTAEDWPDLVVELPDPVITLGRPEARP
jgi:general secretion pathway protein J